MRFYRLNLSERAGDTYPVYDRTSNERVATFYQKVDADDFIDMMNAKHP